MASARQSKAGRSNRRRGSRLKRAIKAAYRRAGRVRGGAARRRHVPPKLPPKILDPRTAQALREYSRAMRFFNQQSYRRAKSILQKLVEGPSRELAERARVHLNICAARLQRPAAPKLRSGDDYYYYGVSLTNLQRYREARAALEKARKLLPKADYVYYALASVAALTGETDEAFENLGRALRMRPENRFHARNDPDLKPLETDPRFRVLLYPERRLSA